MSPRDAAKRSCSSPAPALPATCGWKPKLKRWRDRSKSSCTTREAAVVPLSSRVLYTIDQMANDVAALLQHLGVRSAHVIGHSMGGRIGLSLALNFPGIVKSLVLAASGSGPAGREGPETVPGLPYRLAFDLIEMGFEKYLKHEICDTDTYFTAPYRNDHRDKVQAFYEMVWAYHSKLPEYLQLCIARHNWEATHRLGEVQVPTLVVVGDHDVVGSNHVGQAQVLAKRIPNAEYKMIKGQSHGFFWQAPDETNDWILAWVRNHA